MCYFIFVGIPHRDHAGLVTRLAAAGCEVASTSNAAVLRVFPHGDVISVVSHNGCSCDLYAARTATFDEEALRTQYRKKGWSAAEIEAAILGRRPSERPSFAAFREAFQATVRTAGSVRILAHSFSGDIETEDPAISAHASITLDQYLSADGAYALDVLYDVKAG